MLLYSIMFVKCEERASSHGKNSKMKFQNCKKVRLNTWEIHFDLLSGIICDAALQHHV
jgi:hypothetical protein